MSALEKIFSQAADRTAVVIGPEEITYGRLCADIRSMACWLAGNGLEPGMRVELFPEHLRTPSYWDWIMHLGAIQAGLVHSTGALPAKLVQTGAVGRKQAVVGNLDKWQPTPGFSGKKLQIKPPSLAPLAEQIDIPDAGISLDGREEHAGRILTTSGTTGMPKLVLWNSAMIAGRLAQLGEAGGIGASTRLITGLGFPTTAGFRNPIAVWQAGGSVILTQPGDTPEATQKAFEMSNLIVSSPLYLRTLLEAMKGQKLPGKENRILKLFGGRLPQSLRDSAEKQIADKIILSYGSTETGSIATGDASLVDRHPGAVGFALPGVAVEVTGPGAVPQPAGKEGLVRIKSDVMCQNYAVARSSGDRAPFRDGWFYPGDLGVIFEDGMIAITGRMTDTINVEGIKLSAVSIETKLAALPGIDDVCVVSAQLEKQDTLAVTLVCRDDVDLKQMRGRIATFLPPNTRFVLVRVAELPRNAMGKIMRIPLTAKVTKIIQGNQRQPQRVDA